MVSISSLSQGDTIQVKTPNDTYNAQVIDMKQSTDPMTFDINYVLAFVQTNDDQLLALKSGNQLYKYNPNHTKCDCGGKTHFDHYQKQTKITNLRRT